MCSSKLAGDAVLLAPPSLPYRYCVPRSRVEIDESSPSISGRALTPVSVLIDDRGELLVGQLPE